MRVLLAALIGVSTYVGSVTAAEENPACAVAEALAHPESPLPRVADAVKARSLTVVVMGTGSSTLPGPNGAQLAYPARFEATLAEKLPGVAVKVVANVKSRRTATDMATEFADLLTKEKPALVVWQTGTFDAIKGVESDAFYETLEKGIDQLQAAGADVVFINMQYSPRTDLVLAVAHYDQTMRRLALQRDVPLFDRSAIMRQWGDLGTFDLYAATKSLDTAGKVHGCIGRLLAGFIVEAAKSSDTGPGEIQKEIQKELK